MFTDPYHQNISSKIYFSPKGERTGAFPEWEYTFSPTYFISLSQLQSIKNTSMVPAASFCSMLNIFYIHLQFSSLLTPKLSRSEHLSRPRHVPPLSSPCQHHIFVYWKFSFKMLHHTLLQKLWISLQNAQHQLQRCNCNIIRWIFI